MRKTRTTPARKTAAPSSKVVNAMVARARGGVADDYIEPSAATSEFGSAKEGRAMVARQLLVADSF